MKDRLVYLTFRLMAGAFGILPAPAIRRVGRAMGYAWYYVVPRKRRMAKRHLTRVLGTVPEAAAVRDMFAWYGLYWAEIFWMRPHRLDYVLEHAAVEHLDRFHEARRNPNGTVVALAHLGNWEVAGTRSAAEGTRALAVAEALANRRIVEWFIRLRNDMGTDVVIAEKGASVTKTLLKHLRQGGLIALLCDRDITGTGVPVTFFGEETTIPAGPVALADRTGATLIAIAVYFREGAGHRFVVHGPIPIPDAPTAEERVAAGSQIVAHQLEEMIREAPTQWHIFQPNWPSDRA